MQPITGTLKIRLNGEVKPVEFYEITMTINGRDVTFPTGKGGEFDIDLSQSKEFKKLAETEESGCAALTAGSSSILKPGTYQAAVTYEGKPYAFNLTIPKTADPIIDLGLIIVDASPEPGKEPLVKQQPVPEKARRN